MPLLLKFTIISLTRQAKCFLLPQSHFNRSHSVRRSRAERTWRWWRFISSHNASRATHGAPINPVIFIPPLSLFFFCLLFLVWLPRKCYFSSFHGWRFRENGSRFLIFLLRVLGIVWFFSFSSFHWPFLEFYMQLWLDLINQIVCL